jgi:hypothetical protein
MFVIGDIAVEEKIAHARFACDLGKCMGACCTLPGGRGAPLADEEVAKIEEAFPHAVEYLSIVHQDHIAKFGAVEGFPGSYATVCVDDRACVFVYYERGVARCSIEKAFNEGKTDFRKPVSCHLFPIRASGLDRASIRYEELRQCEDAKIHGKAAQVPLYEFLKDALIRKFGGEWYAEFQSACRNRDQHNVTVLEK